MSQTIDNQPKYNLFLFKNRGVSSYTYEYLDKNIYPDVPNISEPIRFSSSTLFVDENTDYFSLLGSFGSADFISYYYYNNSGNYYNNLGNASFEFASGIGDEDNDKFYIINNELRLISTLDYETESSYSIRVKTTDQNGLEFYKSFTIEVIDLPRAIYFQNGLSSPQNYYREEGQTINIDISTRSFPKNSGELVYWSINGFDQYDFSDTPLNGSFYLDENGKTNLQLTISNDLTNESFESGSITFYSDTSRSKNIGTANIHIYDTSNLDSLINEALNNNASVLNASSYLLTIDEGVFNDDDENQTFPMMIVSEDEADYSLYSRHILATGVISYDDTYSEFSVRYNGSFNYTSEAHLDDSYISGIEVSFENYGDIEIKGLNIKSKDLDELEDVFYSNDNLVIGTNNDDTIIGLDGDDELFGMSGNDILLGGSGNDTAIYRGRMNDYKLTRVNNIYNLLDTRSGSPDGEDELDSIEWIQFENQTISFQELSTLLLGRNYLSTPLGDSFNGGLGDDTVIYSGNHADYTFTRGTETLQIVGTTNGTDTLKNIEYIQFTDQTVEESKVDVIKRYSGNFSDYKFYNKGNGVYQIKTDSGYDDITGYPLLSFTGEASTSSFRDVSAIVDIKGTFDQVTGLNTDSGRIFRLYNASFKRLPDADGLKYWIDNFSSGRNTIRVVASSFLGSAEFKQRYGEDVSDATFVNTLYKNVLGREADASGLLYWTTQLMTGAETRYEALLGFADSAENKALFTDMTGFGWVHKTTSIPTWNTSNSITSITELMSLLRSLVKVERSSQQRKVWGGLDQAKFTLNKDRKLNNLYNINICFF